MAWRAVWDKINQSAKLVCRATVIADYAKILLLREYKLTSEKQIVYLDGHGYSIVFVNRRPSLFKDLK